MNEPSMDQIITARNRCAQIIALYGERYLPIFERLETEIKLQEKKQKLLEKALSLSSQIGTRNGTQIGTHLKYQFNNQAK